MKEKLNWNKQFKFKYEIQDLRDLSEDKCSVFQAYKGGNPNKNKKEEISGR